jgi:hypothetical protein
LKQLALCSLVSFSWAIKELKLYIYQGDKNIFLYLIPEYLIIGNSAVLIASPYTYSLCGAGHYLKS